MRFSRERSEDMGKPTGFLDYTRADNRTIPPRERLGNFQEFHLALTNEERREQGGRCMNCGVPFCQSAYGCPLRNLIPEWNDEIWHGNWSHALSRVLKTNSFPEFTGRVCPAPCETACTCGAENPCDAVTIRENELAVSDFGWANGLMTPVIPKVRTGKKIAIVGSGPSGLACAEILNQRGHFVTVYERDDMPGGLLMYGIPAMKLDKAVITRRVDKMQTEGIAFLCRTEVGKQIKGSRLIKENDAIVLCCGARKARSVQGADAGLQGVHQALEYLSESTKSILDCRENRLSAKGLNVLVVGNGDTATDCVATALRQGAKTVTQLVRKPRPVEAGRVWPYCSSGEKTAYGQEEAFALFGHDPRRYETSIQSLLTDENGILTAAHVIEKGQEKDLPAEMILLAAGFAGAESLSAETFGLSLDKKGRLGGTDGFTENPKIFACGDLRTGPSLVVRAIAEGRQCARNVDRFLEGYTNL